MFNQKEIEKFKEFLNSDTPQATITKLALCTVAVASIPALGITALAVGNIMVVFKKYTKNKNYKNKQFSDGFANLRRQKLIEYVSDRSGVTTVRITSKGESKLRSFAIDLLTISKPKHWDGKWRMVMFDLPVRYNKARHSLRFKLKQLGFVQFQKSVWIYPYPCVDEILFIADYYKVGKYVEVLTVSEINNDLKLKKAFNLK